MLVSVDDLWYRGGFFLDRMRRFHEWLFEKVFFYRKNNKEKISYRNIGSYCNLNS